MESQSTRNVFHDVYNSIEKKYRSRCIRWNRNGTISPDFRVIDMKIVSLELDDLVMGNVIDDELVTFFFNDLAREN